MPENVEIPSSFRNLADSGIKWLYSKFLQKNGYLARFCQEMTIRQNRSDQGVLSHDRIRGPLRKTRDACILEKNSSQNPFQIVFI